MIDTKNWNFLYKLDSQGRNCVSQHTYEPLLNPEENILCYNFAQHNNYCNKILKTETCEFFFQREIESLENFKLFDWCPTLIDVEYNNRKIYIEFSNNLINHLIQKNPQSIDYYQESAITVMKDLYKLDKGKISIHPQCFFLTTDGKIKTIDFFSSFEFSQSRVDRNLVDDILSHNSKLLFRNAPFFDGLTYDLLEIYKFLLENDVWGEEKLSQTLSNLEE